MVWWLLAFASSGPTVAAGPAYLSCALQRDDGSSLAVELSADEANQQVVLSLPSTGRVVTLPALFSPSEVRIADGPGKYTVNRVDLTFTRTIVIGDKQWVEPGKCFVKPAPAKRAF